jgi:hypothetical protein
MPKRKIKESSDSANKTPVESVILERKKKGSNLKKKEDFND